MNRPCARIAKLRCCPACSPGSSTQGRWTLTPAWAWIAPKKAERDLLVSDAEFDAFRAFCRANGHLGDDSPMKTSNDAGLRLALTATIAYQTGKALDQVIRISRTQISDEEIEFGKRKRGAGTLVTWTPALRAAVGECKALPAKTPEPALDPQRRRPAVHASRFKAMWQRMMRAWVADGHQHFTFHDLRAKTATDATEAGRKASDFTGHRTEAVVSRAYDRRRVRKSPAAR